MRLARVGCESLFVKNGEAASFEVNQPVLLQPREGADAPRYVLIVEREVDDEAAAGASPARTSLAEQEACESVPDFSQAEDFDQLGATPESSSD